MAEYKLSQYFIINTPIVPNTSIAAYFHSWHSIIDRTLKICLLLLHMLPTIAPAQGSCYVIINSFQLAHAWLLLWLNPSIHNL